jgi:hypothetical protein
MVDRMTTVALSHMGSRRAGSRSRIAGAVLLLVLGLLLSVLMFSASPASAASTKKALVLDSSVSGGSSSLEAQRAAALGFNPIDVVDDATWGSMTAAQFAAYQLIIVGDPTCSSLSEVVSQNATNLANAVMGRAGGNPAAGNRILVGTDPVYHQGQGGAKFIDAGIDFAGVQPGVSGLYLDFTCGDEDYDSDGTGDGQQKLLPLLSVIPGATWTQNPDAPCGGDVSLISRAAQFSSLSSNDIRGWGCSVHESFPTFPFDWTALAIATDTPTKPTCGSDVDTGETRCGEAYDLIAGAGITAEAPNLKLTPKTATNPVGTKHTVTAKAINDSGGPLTGVGVSFVVTGANSGASGTCNPADCKTTASGEVTFTYTGANLGDDTIYASATINESRQTTTAAKKWVPATAGAASCVRRPISLVRADVRGRNVVLTGLVAPAYVGQSIRILANSSGAKKGALTRLATVKSRPDGQFTATVKRPARKRFARARYQAQVGQFRSPALKLPQSLTSSSVKQVGAQIQVRGHIKRSLLGRRNPVVVKRLVCGRYRSVGQAKPDRKGNYVVRFSVPANVTVALFRAEGRVLNKARGRGKHYVKQYARAISITLTNQTG